MEARWLILVAATLPAAAPLTPAQPGRAGADPVLAWNQEALAAVRAERTPPPQAARHLALLHAAVCDAVNAVGRGHRHFYLNAVPPPGTSAEAAAAAAAHRILVALYPAHGDRFDLQLRRSLSAVPDQSARVEGVALGRFIAGEYIIWRGGDGSRRESLYMPQVGPGAWRPTPPDYRPALAPHWPKVTCFALTSGRQFRPPAPPAVTTAEFAESLKEVRQLGGTRGFIRTPEQTTIARFWEDGVGTVTPPGHWNRIAAEVARRRGLTTAQTARLFALLNVALADAGICCWDCKYHFAYWRPVQAIREADGDDNPATEADPTWEPLLMTPPFPAYPSGHSTFSGAAAAVLAGYFGTDAVSFSTDSEGMPGVVRSFDSFSAAAAEAGRSRIYGGIHYDFDDSAGQALGRDVGRYVVSNFLRPQPAPRAFAIVPDE
jgi:membrane-associated phospholipid phosphatase